MSKDAFDRALRRFQDGLTDEDIAQFRFTKIDDVWEAARYLQREQSSRFSMRNMGRLAPFINGLSRYSGVIEVFVQGKPEIMAFIWGPIKLLLQTASNYVDHFEKLLDAFVKVGENLPRFQAYEKIFPFDERLQEVAAMVYEDIMEFFRRMWKFFRRRSWHILFDSLWNDFQGRFQTILGNLQRHKDLLDKEAHSSEMREAGLARKLHEQKLESIGQALESEIEKATESRRRADIEIEKQEKDRIERQKIAIFNWIASIDCRDDMEKAGRSRHPDTGLWLFDCMEFKDWVKGETNILWLTGKPGSGKTVLAYTMIQELEEKRRKQVLYFFFDYKDTGKNNLPSLLRALTSQLLMLNPELLSYASQWIHQGPSSYASFSALKKHFLELVQAAPESVYIIIDGLDECDLTELPLIQGYLQQLALKQKSFVQICIASRDINLEKGFRGVQIIKLTVGKEKNGKDIQSYITTELQRLQEELELEHDISLTCDYLGIITEKLERLADGMFLWVRLVIQGLFDVTTLEEIQASIDELPGGLDQAYGRILQRIESEPTKPRQRQILRIIKWLACAARPVTVPEVEGWLVVEPGHVDTRWSRPTIRYCGPLIEVLPDLRIQFVHFSAKEYILKGNGGGLHTSPFLTPLAVHLNAFTVCATYLCYNLFGVEAPEAIFIDILNGDYCLLSYCKSYWLHHLEACCELRPDEKSAKFIVSLLPLVLKLRGNRNYEANERDPSITPTSMLQTLENLQRMDSQTLVTIQAVQEHGNKLSKQYKLGLSVEDLQEWHMDKHPLMLTRRYWEVQSLIAKHIMDPASTTCTKQKLRRMHGEKMYLCRHPACESIPKSFMTVLELRRHEDKHSRPFKCPHSICDYNLMGFSTKSGYNLHLKRYHPNPVDSAGVVDFDAFLPAEAAAQPMQLGPQGLQQFPSQIDIPPSQNNADAFVERISPAQQQQLQQQAQQAGIPWDQFKVQVLQARLAKMRWQRQLQRQRQQQQEQEQERQQQPQ